MDFSWLGLLRAVHVLGAAVWFGGIAISTLLIGPAVKAAGPVGGQFMAIVQKRGGFARIMGPVAAVTLLSGLWLYWQMGLFGRSFSTVSVSLLTLGALAAVGGWLVGMVAVMPVQKRMKAMSAQIGPDGPNPDQAAAMKRMAGSMEKRGNVFVVLITLAMLLMLSPRIVVA